MSTTIYVNLPVKDLGKATAFYEALGYELNPQFSDENASAVVISEHIVVMLLAEPFFSTFTKKEIADATKTTESILCLSAESREAVDALVDKAFESGGSLSNDPMDEGFMYGRSFQDPDGHQWEVMWMDVAAAQGQAS